MATSLIGAFLAIAPDPLEAAVGGLVAMGLAGERAAPKSGGPGTFRSHLLDAVAALDEATVNQGQKASFA
jgi:hydroxyethylthiazole kinase